MFSTSVTPLPKVVDPPSGPTFIESVFLVLAPVGTVRTVASTWSFVGGKRRRAATNSAGMEILVRR